jgi:hypothetical protein
VDEMTKLEALVGQAVAAQMIHDIDYYTGGSTDAIAQNAVVRFLHGWRTEHGAIVAWQGFSMPRAVMVRAPWLTQNPSHGEDSDLVWLRGVGWLEYGTCYKVD